MSKWPMDDASVAHRFASPLRHAVETAEQENVRLREALAVAQAQAARLREAIEQAFYARTEGEANDVLHAALASPLDTSALDAVLPRPKRRKGA